MDIDSYYCNIYPNDNGNGFSYLYPFYRALSLPTYQF